MPKVQLEPGWLAEIGDQFDLPYMQELRSYLAAQMGGGKTVYPAPSNWFHAFNSTPWSQVRVVILGQDPYHGPGQAHGLSFSVPEGVPLPPSLRNIYQELASDLDTVAPVTGNLEKWAEQGVLLLNATLTVEAHQAGSHQKRGWETFTDCVVERLNQDRSGLVFVLWGSHAQKKGAIIDEQKHLVLRAPHPSPLSSYRGFFGSRPFSQINQYLEAQGSEPIDWV